MELIIYALPLLVIWWLFARKKNEQNKASLQRLETAKQEYLLLPASLHPMVNHAKCMGCGACTHACPEGDVLGLINGKAELIEGANCIGHGACQAACPFDAIELVFGTQEQGIDIPSLSPEFETTRAGIFIAGELGGMGLIRNAITQGIQSIEAIHKNITSTTAPTKLDVLIIGAGPSGLAAGLRAKSLGMTYKILEQSQELGGTVANFPRKKLVMTQPVNLPLFGKLNFKEVSKEALIDIFNNIVSEHSLDIQYATRVDNIEGELGNFVVNANNQRFNAQAVLLCIGRRGTPRKLGIKGEGLDKVCYSLIDAEQFTGEKVLVVGGGDSALEAAIALAEQKTTSVHLTYRGEGFSRAKAKNRQRIEELWVSGRIELMFKTSPTLISQNSVLLTSDEKTWSIDNDRVIICAGGELPIPMLKNNGINVETKYGER